ncbi:MAG TPA: hypothetical protein VGN04_12280 [Herbaspirillum sp.]|jgi:hypothetical protein
MEGDRQKAWMVARQLSFKHELSEPVGVNSSILMHTEYFVVFWRDATQPIPGFPVFFEVKKSFFSKGKTRLDACRCSVNAIAFLWLTRHCADICSVANGTGMEILAL